MPNDFAQSPEGVLIITSGFDPVLRWDGLEDQAERAGLRAPAAALTLSGSGKGGIVGTYQGYVRFLDRFGNVSNLSPVSADYTAQESTGTITGATNAAPIVITSASHGLTTGARVEIEGVGGNGAANDIWDVTVIDGNRFSLNDSVGTGSYSGGGVWRAGVLTITYTNVATSSEPKVVRRQLLRNTAGQAITYYVDVDTEDLSGTTFHSTRLDTDLLAQESVALFDDDDFPIANAHDPPPDTKAYVANHINRLFYAGEVEYREGNVAVTFGSASVTGIGTEWTEVLPGRFLYVSGATKRYEVLAMDVPNQTLTLTEPYGSATQPYADYAIRPADVERRTVYYSESGQPESVPPFNALTLPDDGDLFTGLMPKDSWLYFLERRHIYRMTARTDPKKDGFVFLAMNRGCVNHRCWVVVEDRCFMLDEAGVHTWAGGEEAESISQPIADFFDGSNREWRINWKNKRFFHAAHHPPSEIIKWFVAFSGDYLPRHALCFEYRSKKWWIEEYPFPVGCSALGRFNGQPVVYLGTEARRVWMAEQGTLDVADAGRGTVRGTATGAGPLTLTDAAASFDTSLANVPVVVVEGRGKGQLRRVVSATATALTVSQPWLILPDSTSVYQVGGVPWRYRTGWFRFKNPREQNTPRRIEVLFQPCEEAATLDLRQYFDRSDVARVQKITRRPQEHDGVGTAKDRAEIEADLTRSSGFVQYRHDNTKEEYTDGPRFIRWELGGVQNADRVEVFQVSLDGVEQ